MDRELLCCPLAKSGSCTPTGSMQTFKTVSTIYYKKIMISVFLHPNPVCFQMSINTQSNI